MAVNKVVFGNEVKMDLTNDTVSAENLLEGETAHDRSGNPVVGTAKQGHSILNKLGTLLTQRSKLKFGGMLKTTDDDTNGITVVSDEAEEIEWSVWDAMTEAEKDAYSAGKKLDIVNAPWASGHVPVELIKTLWENSSPTSDFAEQDISLNSADYDFILILFAHQSGNRMESVIISKGQNSLLNSSQNRTRDFNYTDVTHYHVGVGRLDGNTNNAMCIPIAIYGLKSTVDVDISKIIVDESTKAEKTDIATVESGSTASRAYSVGELVYVNGNLYKVITAITSGATFTVGTNIQSTNVSDVVKEVNSKVEESGVRLLGGTTLTVGNTYQLSDNYLNYKRIIIVYGHNSTGNRYYVTYYPQVGDQFVTLQSVYTSSNINTAALRFTGASMECSNSTSGTTPYIFSITGFKNY